MRGLASGDCSSAKKSARTSSDRFESPPPLASAAVPPVVLLPLAAEAPSPPLSSCLHVQVKGQASR